MKKIVIANWKMNPETEAEAVKLAKAEDFKGVVITPPFVFLENIGEILKKAELGAQDVFIGSKNKKAYTGEVSPEMLKSLGVKYVIVGHSERRKNFKETDGIINKKVLAALKVGLKVILCVGEGKAQRAKGKEAAKRFVASQLKKDLRFPTNYKLFTTHLIVAYEPVWAISSNRNSKSDTPQDALEIIKFIKSILNSQFKIHNSKVLYGGSVSTKTIGGFLKYKEIDGFLVGGASLKVGEFRRIIKAVKI